MSMKDSTPMTPSGIDLTNAQLVAQCLQTMLSRTPCCVVNSNKIKPISVQTQINSIYYIELHVSTYLRSSSGSQLVIKTY